MSEILNLEQLCYDSYAIGSYITYEDTPIVTTTFIGYWILMLLSNSNAPKND